jgi:hypothetical protein
MIARTCGRVLIAAVLSLTCPAAHADDASPILGKWVISSDRLAPWSRPQDAAVLGAEAKKLQVPYTTKAVVAKHPTIGCKDAHYEKSSFPYDALFQGGLGEVSEEARARVVKEVGFPPAPGAGIELDCSTGEFSYHFSDRNTVLVALSDVIYILTRQ